MSSSLWQALLTLRGIKERRFEALGGLRFVQIVAISVICGCLWFNSKQRTAADIADQTGSESLHSALSYSICMRSPRLRKFGITFWLAQAECFMYRTILCTPSFAVYALTSSAKLCLLLITHSCGAAFESLAR